METSLAGSQLRTKLYLVQLFDLFLLSTRRTQKAAKNSTDATETLMKIIPAVVIELFLI